ncbi:type II toxin-antitoxin system VapC family toxin [Amycolatopsis jejuensis]|uniref:type II toxin-antitoxin system VapC family toxin n=1 Tax=Amycolatopsis jejuensis TaxID=330084 RepID=UPI000527CF90|nr:type II toxin-antitoxin system VapC family toxin [Amycolatopsis jejuensis]
MVTECYYADTSALATAYLKDEPGHREMRELLLEGPDLVLSSELTRIELASVFTAAKRSGRLPDARIVLEHFDHLASPDGSLVLIPFRPDRVFPAAQRLVTENYPIRTLDALHLAVVMHETAELTGGEPVTVVTRDERQAEAAKANGLPVR